MCYGDVTNRLKREAQARKRAQESENRELTLCPFPASKRRVFELRNRENYVEELQQRAELREQKVQEAQEEEAEEEMAECTFRPVTSRMPLYVRD